MTESEQPYLKKSGLIGAYGGAGHLVLVDGGVLNQGFLFGVAGLWVLLVSLPRSSLSRDTSQTRRRFQRVATIPVPSFLVHGLTRSALDR